MSNQFDPFEYEARRQRSNGELLPLIGRQIFTHQTRRAWAITQFSAEWFEARLVDEWLPYERHWSEPKTEVLKKFFWADEEGKRLPFTVQSWRWADAE